MRRVKVSFDDYINDRWIISDWKDVDGLLEGIDRELALHGLELVIGNADDDNWYVRVEKR